MNEIENFVLIKFDEWGESVYKIEIQYVNPVKFISLIYLLYVYGGENQTWQVL